MTCLPSPSRSVWLEGVGTRDWEYAHVSLDDQGPGSGGPGRNMPFEARDFGQG